MSAVAQTDSWVRVSFISSDRIRRIQGSLKDRSAGVEDLRQAFIQMKHEGWFREGEGWDVTYFFPEFPGSYKDGVSIAVSLDGNIGVHTIGGVSQERVEVLMDAFHRSLENHLLT